MCCFRIIKDKKKILDFQESQAWLRPCSVAAAAAAAAASANHLTLCCQWIGSK